MDHGYYLTGLDAKVQWIYGSAVQQYTIAGAGSTIHIISRLVDSVSQIYTP